MMKWLQCERINMITVYCLDSVVEEQERREFDGGWRRITVLRVTNPSGNEGVHKSEMSVTLKSSTSPKILCCSLQFS